MTFYYAMRYYVMTGSEIFRLRWCSGQHGIVTTVALCPPWFESRMECFSFCFFLFAVLRQLPPNVCAANNHHCASIFGQFNHDLVTQHQLIHHQLQWVVLVPSSRATSLVFLVLAALDLALASVLHHRPIHLLPLRLFFQQKRRT